MSVNWYYVEGKDRIGPVDEAAIEKLIFDEKINLDTYVWRKGFDNWQKVSSVNELAAIIDKKNFAVKIQKDSGEELIPAAVPTIDWEHIDEDRKIFSIKVGIDRGGNESIYGPYSLIILKKLFKEKRINGKTYIYASGMENWEFLADLPIYKDISGEEPPVILETERRSAIRRPFIARLLFHDSKKVYEGICRDVSIGGMQLLVSSAPVSVGEKIILNVHPDNSAYNFTAEGKVVRLLDGDQGFCVVFTSLGLEAQNAIKKYVETTIS